MKSLRTLLKNSAEIIIPYYNGVCYNRRQRELPPEKRDSDATKVAKTIGYAYYLGVCLVGLYSLIK